MKNLNTPSKKNNRKPFKNTVIALATSVALAWGLSSCNSKEVKDDQKTTPTSGVTTGEAIYNHGNTYEARELQALVDYQNVYEELLESKGKPCYVLERVWEDMWWDNPDPKYLYTEFDLQEYAKEISGEDPDRKVSKKVVNNDVILAVIDSWQNVGWATTFNFWFAKEEEFRNSLK